MTFFFAFVALFLPFISYAETPLGQENFYLKQSLANPEFINDFHQKQLALQLVNNSSRDCYRDSNFVAPVVFGKKYNLKDKFNNQYFKYTFKVNGVIFEGLDQYGQNVRYLLNYSQSDGLFVTSEKMAVALDTTMDNKPEKCKQQLSSSELAQRKKCNLMPQPRTSCDSQGDQRKSCLSNAIAHQECLQKLGKIRLGVLNSCQRNHRSITSFNNERSAIIAESLGLTQETSQTFTEEELDEVGINLAVSWDVLGSGVFKLGSMNVVSESKIDAKVENGSIYHKLNLKTCGEHVCMFFNNRVTAKPTFKRNQVSLGASTGGKKGMVRFGASATHNEFGADSNTFSVSGARENDRIILAGYFSRTFVDGEKGGRTSLGATAHHKSSNTGLVFSNKDIPQDDGTFTERRDLIVKRQLPKGRSIGFRATQDKNEDGDYSNFGVIFSWLGL